MTFVHDFVNEKLPVSFKDVYKMNCNIHGIYETRQAHLLHIPRTKSPFVDRLPLYQFPKIWNNWHKQLNVYTSRSSGLRRTILLFDMYKEWNWEINILCLVSYMVI